MELKADLEDAKKRCEAWWAGEALDRPAIQITAPPDPDSSYQGPEAPTLEDYWTNPDYVLPRWEHRLKETFFGGEAMPVVFPLETGIVSIINKYLGAPNEFVDRSTTWSHPVIDSWDPPPNLSFDPDNPWWRITENLLQAGKDFFEKQPYTCYLGLPDLNGPTEILSGLRGAERFAMDFYDHPDKIVPALRKVQDVWYEAFKRSSAIAWSLGGHFFWMGIWSDLPAIDLQSDVSVLISEEMFDEYFLPFIREQTERVERTVYHLDGPDAVHHIDSLLALPHLDAIQWVQGAGGGATTDWIDLIKKIKANGKRVYVYCDYQEVPILTRELGPEGVMLVAQGCPDRATAEAVLKEALRHS